MKKAMRSLITVGLVTGLLVSNSLMAYAAEWQNINEEWYYVDDDGTITANIQEYVGTFTNTDNASIVSGLSWWLDIDKIEGNSVWGHISYGGDTSGIIESDIEGVSVIDGKIQTTLKGFKIIDVKENGNFVYGDCADILEIEFKGIIDKMPVIGIEEIEDKNVGTSYFSSGSASKQILVKMGEPRSFEYAMQEEANDWINAHEQYLDEQQK